jgi:hypothetical protein
MIVRFTLNKLVEWLLPVLLRRPITFAYINALCKPLKIIEAEFDVFLDAMKLKAYETSQVLVLEHILNTEFDPNLKRIFIEDTGQLNSVKKYIYKISETPAEPVYVRKSTEHVDFANKIFIHKFNFFENSFNQFRVFVPEDMSLEKINSIKLRVNRLKIATTTFVIIKYN